MSEAPAPTPVEPETTRVRLQEKPVKPYATYLLAALLGILFIAQEISRTQTGTDILFIMLGKINTLILRGEVWRFITPALLHGSLYHLGFNLYALYVLGTRIEPIYGHGRFLTLFLLGAFGGNVLSFVLSKSPSLGSSTAIFGLLGAEVAFLIYNRQLFGRESKAMLSNLAFILVLNLMIGIMPGLNIDIWGHAGGLAAGFIFGALAGPRWAIRRSDLGLQIVDTRTKRDLWIGAGMVFIAFAAMALIPFMG